jgi:peptidyl-prolyl cis-trans isomerase D
MLRFFRQGGVAKALVATVAIGIIVVFVLEFRTGRGVMGDLGDECVVELDGYCSRAKEYFAAYNLIAGRRVPPKQAREMALRRRVLEGLVERELLVNAAQRYDIDVSEEAINAELEQGRVHVSLPAAGAELLSYRLGLCVLSTTSVGCEPGTEMLRGLDVLRDGKFDYERYTRSVRVIANRSPKEFKEMQRRELIAARMRALVKTRAQISESEAFRLFERERSRAIARFVQLESGWFARFAPAPTEADVDVWATANAADVERRLAAVKPRFSADCPLVREITVTFEANATDEEKTQQRAEIDAAAARLKKREPFADVARAVSEASSGELGGELGCLGEGYGPGAQTLLQTAGELGPGERSGVLESVRGFHIIELVGRLDQANVEAAAKRHAALRGATDARAKEAAKSFATDLIQRVQGGAKLDEAVAELTRKLLGLEPDAGEEGHAALRHDDRPKVEVSVPFPSSRPPLPNVAPGSDLARQLFALEKPDDVLKQPVETFDGYAVLQLKEKELATRELFDKDRSGLMRELRQAKAAEALRVYVEELRQRAAARLEINEAYATETKEDSPDES